MSNNIPRMRIYVTGTIRGGSSVVSDVLNAHSEIMILTEYIHFFRFIYNYYNPLNEINVKRILHELEARLYWRFRVGVDVEDILNDIDMQEITYAAIYEAIMRYYLKVLGKKIAGEDTPNSWKSIPDLLNLFPDAKVIHVYRDPRAVLSSWKKASRHITSYLGAIFNCKDNLELCNFYSKSLPTANYLPVKYEDIVQNPEREVRNLCSFLEVDFEPLMIQPEKWNEIFDGVIIKRGWSSDVGEMIKGFDSSRIDAWKESIVDWELCLCEWLLRDNLEEFNYESTKGEYDIHTFLMGIETLRSDPFLYKLFSGWLTLNQGSDSYLNDPRDPTTWGVFQQAHKKFIETDDGKKYLKAIEVINKRYSQIL